MTVKIKTPSVVGDTVQELELPQAKEYVEGHIQNGWVATINKGIVQNTESMKDGDEVVVYPPIGGG